MMLSQYLSSTYVFEEQITNNDNDDKFVSLPHVFMLTQVRQFIPSIR